MTDDYHDYGRDQEEEEIRARDHELDVARIMHEHEAEADRWDREYNER